MKKLLPTNDLDKYSKIYQLLGYQEVNRRVSLFKGLSIVTYKKEKEINKTLKARYAPYSVIPFFFVIVFIALAVIFATTYLILNFTIANFDKLTYFYILMLPTSIFTITATGITFYRYFIELKNLERLTAIPLLEKEVMKNESSSGRQEQETTNK